MSWIGHATTYAAGSLLPVEVRGEAELGAALSWAGAAPMASGCPVENAEGSFTFTGRDVTVVTFDGAVACDGIVMWRSDHGDGGPLLVGTTAL